MTEPIWREVVLNHGPSPCRAVVVGDVRQVLYSRAADQHPLPSDLSHGLGVLTPGAAHDAGEGILVRGKAHSTPPGKGAGIVLRSLPQRPLMSSFFLGWKGIPKLSGGFSGASGLTMRSFFEGLHEIVAAAHPESDAPAALFVEALLLAPLSGIRDRALRHPVHQGGRLITSEEFRDRYFLFKPIQQDHDSYGACGGDLLVLGLAGVAVSVEPRWQGKQRLETFAFYQPPRQGADPGREPIVRVHSHALGWNGDPVLVSDFRTSLDGSSSGVQAAGEILWSEFQERTPDYLVHLDDDSTLSAGFFQVFTLEREDRITYLP